MKKEFNSFQVSGFVAADATVVTTTTGKEVVKFSLPIHEHKKNLAEGEKDPTVWMNFEKWNPSAETLALIKKGNFITVTGELRVNSYVDKEQKLQTKLIVNAKSIEAGKETEPKNNPEKKE